MTIEKQRLREELSNPAIGSNAHLRKLALALLDELEAADSGFPPLTVERLMREKDALEKRVVELEARMVKLPERYEVDMCPTPSPVGEWFSREDVLAALVTASVRYAAAGKGE
ncbi:TPA: hypothetical protein ACKFVZ_002920 [Citrobacter koseri]|uniref:hypothetical protein n=1 Tax=Citrobacter koseri TaxID=545 RepID=UPI001E4E07AF|nr:hypothetical protein [Citrobacter koseri]